MDTMADIDSMFSDLLGEMDLLTQSIGDETEPTKHKELQRNYSIGFKDMNESLNELEDNDLDKLMADLETKQQALFTSRTVYNDLVQSTMDQEPTPLEAPRPLQTSEPPVKADKVKLALERLKEAKVKKLIVKVWMSDGSSKTLMVDERQTVRDVLDNLFEKTHCDRSVDWSLCETNPELQTERGFEDHEHLAEPLSAWPRDTQNRMCFVSSPQKYVIFKEPQIYYMWKQDDKCLSEIKNREKELLLQENFEGQSVKVPDLEGVLYLKEDGKKAWKQRYFLLRASGIYWVPKGKSKSSSDLSCFIHFDNVNIYTTNDYRQKYKAPTDFCFILKHPRIQKESEYIKFLCCEDEHTLSLWVNSIRIAKYGSSLYKNYQTAVKTTSAVFSTFSSLSAARQPTPSTVHKAYNRTEHTQEKKDVQRERERAQVNTNGQEMFPPPPPAVNVQGMFPPPPPAVNVQGMFPPPPPAVNIDDQSEPQPDFHPPPPLDLLTSPA